MKANMKACHLRLNRDQEGMKELQGNMLLSLAIAPASCNSSEI